jgi:hypothetical protein
MLRSVALACTMLAAPLAAAQPPTQASAALTPRSAELFQSDWVLMNWALKNFDSNRDVLLSTLEAQAAAQAFRKIADGDGDGRVTPQEYAAARAFILARY